MSPTHGISSRGALVLALCASCEFSAKVVAATDAAGTGSAAEVLEGAALDVSGREGDSDDGPLMNDAASSDASGSDVAVDTNDFPAPDTADVEDIAVTYAKAGDFPFVVSVQAQDGTHLCTGVVVGPYRVLTTAHCVAGLAPEAVRVATNRVTLSSTTGDPPITVTQVDLHGDLPKGKVEADVAVLRLAWPTDVAPLRIASDHNPNERPVWKAGTKLITVGWGRSNCAGTMDDALRAFAVDRLPDTLTATADPAWSVTVGAPTSVAEWRDNDGAALLARAPAGEWRLVGVASAVSCDAADSARYVRVADPSAGTWTRQAILATPLLNDIDGDGNRDIVLFTHEPHPRVYVSLSELEHFKPELALWIDYSGHALYWPLLGDLDGDGLVDAWAVGRDAVWIGPNQGGLQVGSSVSRTGLGMGAGVPLLGDMNGDQRADLVLYSHDDAGNVTVFLATPSGVSDPTLWGSGVGNGHTTLIPGDVNGDGLDDLVLLEPETKPTNLWVAASTGSDLAAPIAWGSGVVPSAVKGYVGRVNADAHGDLVYFERGGSANVYVALSTGEGFADATVALEGRASPNAVPAVGDVNADGLDDIVEFAQDMDAKVFVSINQDGVFGPRELWHSHFAP